MHRLIFQLCNDYGIPLPPLSAGVREEGLFFRRFRGLVFPGRPDSIIGRGGSGVIHVVRDEILDRIVALKLPTDAILAEEQVRNDVLNEASQALELTHPNIVRIYDFHEQDGRWGISMQYVRGRNLDEWREQLAPHQMAGGSFYDADQIRSWILQLCEALSYAHDEAGVAHCDIKPRNLLLERSFDSRARKIREKLLLTDFGITQRLRDFTQRTQQHRSTRGSGDEGGAAGTLAYMSPQQLAGKEGAITDDIYAIGVTIFELLTGRPPFHQGESRVIQHQIESVEPPSMMERRRERGVKSAAPIPDHWEQVVAQCLNKDPDMRPANAWELARLLGLHSNDIQTVSLKDQRRQTREQEELRETLTAQTSQIDELTKQVRQLETATTGKVDATLLAEATDSVAELEKELRRKDARLVELDDQVQELREDKLQLEGQLASSNSGSDAEKAELAERVESMLQQLQVLEANSETLLAERDQASAALNDAKASIASTEASYQKQLRQSKEELARLPKVEGELQRTKAALKQVELEHQKSAKQQSLPLKPVLMTLVVFMAAGLLLGTLTAFFTRSSPGSGQLAQLAVENGEMVVQKRHFKTYLESLDLDESAFGNHFASLRDDEPATGLTWLEAAAFCEWLSVMAELDTRNEWFDLPSMADLDGQSSPCPEEWTREESEIDGVSRRMRLFQSGAQSDAQNKSMRRTERSELVGFRVILRQAN